MNNLKNNNHKLHAFVRSKMVILPVGQRANGTQLSMGRKQCVHSALRFEPLCHGLLHTLAALIMVTGLAALTLIIMNTIL